MYYPDNHQSGRGLYIVTMAIPNKIGTHYAILDVGNVSGRSGSSLPTIHHLRPTGIISTTDTKGVLTAQKISDEMGAVARLEHIRSRPIYRLLTNNCEHFARYIAYGDHSSAQAVVLGLVATAAIGYGAYTYLKKA